MSDTETIYTPETKDLKKIDEAMEALPEVQAGKDVWQNNFHEFDVYGHTREFVRNLKEVLEKEGKPLDPNILSAGWLHDIGKPPTATPRIKDGVQQMRVDGKPYHDFTDHEIVGEKMVLEMDPNIFAELGLDQKKVAALVYCHYLPMKGIKETRGTGNWHDFLERYEGLKKVLADSENSTERPPVTKEEVMLMFLADKLGEGDSEKFVTDRGELLAVREAILAPDPAEEERILHEVYEMQKRQAEANKSYAAKA